MVEAGAPDRQQVLYWKALVELKVACAYMCRYRDHLGGRVQTLAVLRAVASSAAIAGWAVWQSLAFVWGAIIALAQVADAIKDIFPFARTHKAASGHAIILERLFIDAQLEWESVFEGRLTAADIMRRRHKLMKLQHDAEVKGFPAGLSTKPVLFALAQQEAKAYFSATYGV